MKDPYVYPDSSVLNNKFDIKDKRYLEKIETTITAKRLFSFEEFLKGQDKADYESLKAVHEYIFSEIYPFAGKERTIQIYKSEKELYGDTVRYSTPKEIKKDAKKIISTMDKIKWNKISFNEKCARFAEKIAGLWQVHPFREGNTRTVMCFAELYAKKQGLFFDRNYIAAHSGYVRNSLVLASDGMYSDYKKINEIFRNAITAEEKDRTKLDVGHEAEKKGELEVLEVMELDSWKGMIEEARAGIDDRIGEKQHYKDKGRD